MNILLPCVLCGDEGSAARYSGELLDGEPLAMACTLGHKSQLVLLIPRYELLFESGLLAFVDGYPREAVTSFAVSVERFHEFWLESVFASRGVAQSVRLAGGLETDVGSYGAAVWRRLRSGIPCGDG